MTENSERVGEASGAQRGNQEAERVNERVDEIEILGAEMPDEVCLVFRPNLLLLLRVDHKLTQLFCPLEKLVEFVGHTVF